MANIIRKIVVGSNPKDAMAYVVGMRAGNGEVSIIDKDESDPLTRKYDVYIEDEDNTILWKSIENLPVLIEYDCNFD